jgi:hypothetical protein
VAVVVPSLVKVAQDIDTLLFAKKVKQWLWFFFIFICPKEFRAYYVIPPGVCPSVCLSVYPSVRPLAIWFPEHNLSSIWPTIFKLHRMIVHIGWKTPIDFWVTRSKVKVTITLKLKTVSGA